MSVASQSFASRHAVVVGVLFLGLLGLGVSRDIVGASDESSRLGELAEAQSYARGLSRAFQHVAETVEPSVVSIKATRRVQPTRSPFGGSFSPFRERRSFEQRGIGTGVIVREDGYVVTNNHVVAGADLLQVTLHDGQVLEAELVGADAETDLAVLRIPGEHEAVDLGNSEQVQAGQWVVAVGTPFGLSQSVTTGIVSAVGRANVGITEYENFIQTDAAINPGNSGGPLLDLDGRLVGINTAIASRSGGFQGIGFAIPVNMVSGVVDTLIDSGRVRRGWLGVAIQDLTPETSRVLGVGGSSGVLVGEVTVGGPAESAGLQAGDLILAYDGEATKTLKDVRDLVARTRPGSRVPLSVQRDGEKIDLEVRIAERVPALLRRD